MNAVLDMTISVLPSKCENSKFSFNCFIEVLGPNVTAYNTESFTEAIQNVSELLIYMMQNP